MFKLYDSLLFTGRPASAVWGAEPLKLFYQQFVLDQPANTLPTQAVMNQRLATHANFEGPLCFDIELIAHTDAASLAEYSIFYNQLTAMIRIACPKAKIGYYGLPPIRQYWPVINRLTDPASYNFWKNSNDQIKGMADPVDLCFPSLYTFYGSVPAEVASWCTYARENIREARRSAPGKPIFPFIWPQFHESNAVLGGQLVPGEYFRMQLELIKDEGCAGAVIWGGFQVAWNNASPWYVQTQDFAASRAQNMARTKSQDIMIAALGRRRSEVAARIAELQASTLQQLQAELIEIEAQLQAIDPTIPPL